MFAPSVRIIVELPVQIARIEPGEARAGLAIAFAPQAMAGEAGGRRAAIAAAHRDRLAGRPEGIAVRRRVASHEREQKQKGSGAHHWGTNLAARWFPTGA